MRLILTFHGRYMPRHMLSFIRTYYASLNPWMCDGHLVGHLISISFVIALFFNSYIGPVPVSLASPSTYSAFFLF